MATPEFSIHSSPSATTKPLVVFAGGGTGGHLYPAIAIAQALRKETPEARFMFFGTRRPIDQQVLGPMECELIRQRLPTLSARPWRWAQSLLALRDSCREARRRIQKDPPVVVIGTGGIGSVPAVRAAHRAGCRTALLNPDALPGRANRYLARMADVIFAQWAETADHFSATRRVVVCGCPVRVEFGCTNRLKGVHRFALDAKRKTLLITGASQGARSINQAVLANLPFLKSQKEWQVLHLTGLQDHDAVKQAYAGSSIPATVVPYTDDMADALAAADLIISRAGASTLAEITVVGRPSILLPYPYHKDMHQLRNARCLERASAALVVPDSVDPAINGPKLREALEPLMTDRHLRDAMAAAAKRAGKVDATSCIVDHIRRDCFAREHGCEI